MHFESQQLNIISLLFSSLRFFWFLICSPEHVACIDEESGSIFKLNNGIVLYLRQINQFLVLVCILREFNFARQGLIEYNFSCLKDTIHKLFAVTFPKRSEDNQTEDDDDDDDGDEASGQANNNNGQPYDNRRSSYRSNTQLTNYLLEHKFHNKSLDDLN